MSIDLNRWRIQRLPDWIVKALDLTTRQAPQGLELSPGPAGGLGASAPDPSIQTIVDAYQGGVGIAQQFFKSGVVLDAAVTQSAIMTPQVTIGDRLVDDPDSAALLLALSVQSNALAGTRHLELVLVRTSVVSTPLSVTDVASNTIVGWTSIAGNMDARIYVPPGYHVTAVALDLIAAETFTLNAIGLTVPAGFKPY